MKVYVGVDWSATELVCSVAVEDGAIRRFGATVRTLAGVRELVERARSLASEAEVHVVIEAGAPGWVELLHHAGAIVHVADPKQAQRFAESRGSSGAKDDDRDSGHLVAIGRSPDHAPKPWSPPTELRAQLDVLGEQHETLTAEQTAACQRLRGALRESFPALEALFDDVKRGWVLALLKVAATPWHAARFTEEALAEALKGATKAMRTKVRAVLQAADAPWLTEGRARIEALRIGQLVATLEQLAAQLAMVEAELDALTSDLRVRKQLDGVSGIGLKMALRLLQFAFDDLPADRDEVAVRMGAAPVFRGSAKTKHGKPKGTAMMRRAASPRARASVYLLGRLVSQQLEWARRMYADGRRRGQSAGTAYRRIARCMLRILTAMVRSGEDYDDSRYTASLRAKGVPWMLEGAA